MGFSKIKRESRKILICESSAISLRFFTTTLENHSFEVVQAKSESSAATLSRTKAFDLFIIDVVNQNGINTLNLCKALRVCDKTKLVPIILTTTRVTEDFVIRLKELSIKDVLIKPITKETLLGKVLDIVNHKN